MLAIGVVLVLVTTIAAGGVYAVYNHLNSNIVIGDPIPSASPTSASVAPSQSPTSLSASSASPRPVTSSAPPTPTPTYEQTNILLMGSDTRDGIGNSQYGNPGGGARSDTLILVHLSADRKRALAVSIPRDTYVAVPSCRDANGAASAPYSGLINSAFATGGPVCSVLTVEQLSGIHIDHYVVIDFAGFKNLIDAVGGVPVCLPVAVNDPYSGLNLSAGPHMISGDTALSFVRVRHGIGDGSDLGRIVRQQQFMFSLWSQVQSKSVLLNPLRLNQVLNAATKSMTVDPGIGGLAKLGELASQLHGLKSSGTSLLTVPYVSRPGDPNHVIVDNGRAAAIWAAIKADTPYPAPPTPPVDHGTPLTVVPTTINVAVMNGSGLPGRATAVANQLQQLGFNIVKIGAALRGNYVTSELRYSSNRSQSARTLATSLAMSTTILDPSLGDVVTIIVGSDPLPAAIPVVLAASGVSGSSGVNPICPASS